MSKFEQLRALNNEADFMRPLIWACPTVRLPSVHGAVLRWPNGVSVQDKRFYKNGIRVKTPMSIVDKVNLINE